MSEFCCIFAFVRLSSVIWAQDAGRLTLTLTVDSFPASFEFRHKSDINIAVVSSLALNWGEHRGHPTVLASVVVNPLSLSHFSASSRAESATIPQWHCGHLIEPELLQCVVRAQRCIDPVSTSSQNVVAVHSFIPYNIETYCMISTTRSSSLCGTLWQCWKHCKPANKNWWLVRCTVSINRSVVKRC